MTTIRARRLAEQAIAAACLVGLAACGESSQPGTEPTTNDHSETGGSTNVAGDPGSGASQTPGATGGLPGAGGVVNTGGPPPATGGSAGAGAAYSTGGLQNTGTVVNTGGLPAAGGLAATGGVPSTGGDIGTGGVPITGGATGGDPSTGGVSTGGSPTTGGGAGCENGPLAASLPNCEIKPPAGTGDYHADCVAEVNRIRWECQCLPPLERRADGEACADQMAQYDYENNVPHGGMQTRLCTPAGWGQCECPGWDSAESITQGTNFYESCLAAMWHEVDNPAGEQGHYEAMSSQEFTGVACGIYIAPDGEVWALQNYFE